MSVSMMYLQSRSHCDQVVDALQNNNEHDLAIIGNDLLTSHCGILWVLSPFVRSLVGSLKNIKDSLIILPDFTYVDIITGLDIIEGNVTEMSFDLNIKDLLETLGLDLTNVLIKREEPHNDDVEFDVDKIQNLLLEQISAMDDEEKSDDENTSQNIDAEKSIDIETEEVSKEDGNLFSQTPDENEYENEYDQDFQDQLMKNQTFSDDEDSGESMVSPIQDEVGINPDNKNVEECSEDQFIQETLLMEQDLSSDDDEADQLNEETVEGTKDSDKSEKVRNPRDVGTDLQQQKLQEVEDLMVEENGLWKCKVCKRTKQNKSSLRSHAEYHVTGLSFPCNICNEIFTTRSRLASHKHSTHNQKKKRGASAKSRVSRGKPTEKNNDDLLKENVENDTGKIYEDLNNEEEGVNSPAKYEGRMLTEYLFPEDVRKEVTKKVKELIEKKDHNLWKCMKCWKTASRRTGILDHIETHLEYTFQCPLCPTISETRRTLKEHFRATHRK